MTDCYVTAAFSQDLSSLVNFYNSISCFAFVIRVNVTRVLQTFTVKLQHSFLTVYLLCVQILYNTIICFIFGTVVCVLALSSRGHVIDSWGAYSQKFPKNQIIYSLFGWEIAGYQIKYLQIHPTKSCTQTKHLTYARVN